MPCTRAHRLRRWALLLCAGPGLAVAALAQPADVLALGGADAATESVFVRALTAQWLGDHEEAIELFTRVLERRPDEPAVLAAMARSDAALGRSAEALSLISRAAALAPDNPALLGELATAQRELGQTEAAATSLARLVTLRPDDRIALSALAELHEEAGRPREALAALEDLLRVGGESESVRLRMHAQLERMGDGNRARSVLVEGAAALPGARTLRLRLARAYRDAGRSDSAAAALDELLASDPSDVEAGALRDEMTGTPARAQDEGEPSTRLRRAGALLRQADEDPEAAGRARLLVESIAEGVDAPPEALRILGLLEMREGRHARAAALLDGSLARDPRHLDAWVGAVESHRLSGDPRAAASAADEALILFPGQPALLEAAAAAFAASGRTDDARAAIDEALSLEEPDGLTESLRERLVRAREALD